MNDSRPKNQPRTLTPIYPHSISLCRSRQRLGIVGEWNRTSDDCCHGDEGDPSESVISVFCHEVTDWRGHTRNRQEWRWSGFEQVTIVYRRLGLGLFGMSSGYCMRVRIGWLLPMRMLPISKIPLNAHAWLTDDTDGQQTCLGSSRWDSRHHRHPRDWLIDFIRKCESEIPLWYTPFPSPVRTSNFRLHSQISHIVPATVISLVSLCSQFNWLVLRCESNLQLVTVR